MKDPAFLFYPNDWLGGTMGMTFEEKGAYMELLMMQFNRGHMTTHMIGQTVGQLWDKINDKFIVDDNGLYYNERLEIEQNKRKAFTESRRNNINGENQYTKKSGHMTKHMNGHMENRNRNENTIEDKKEILREKARKFKVEVFTFNEYPTEMLNKFFEYWIEPNKSYSKMRFELEKTWDLNLRLKKWSNNQKEFSKQERPINVTQSLHKDPTYRGRKKEVDLKQIILDHAAKNLPGSGD